MKSFRLSIFISFIVISGCASTDGPNEEAGMIIGGVLGGILGNEVGGGHGRTPLLESLANPQK
jgi:uncharacterized protein YcfJ